MPQIPEPFGLSVSVDDLTSAKRFYQDLYDHDHVTEGVFAGIPYIGIMRDGETVVNIFQRGETNPLAPSLPTVKVDSVAVYEEKVRELGGTVLISSATCPCTGAQFAVCTDRAGNQFMIKEPRSTA